MNSVRYINDILKALRKLIRYNYVLAEFAFITVSIALLTPAHQLSQIAHLEHPSIELIRPVLASFPSLR